MKVLLLSGGSGRRLWPLSNDYCSKQYIKIMNKSGLESGEKCSMLQRVFDQLSQNGFKDDSIIIASEAQTEIIQSQLGRNTKIATEPERRDTFPAILLGAAWCASNGANEDEIITVMPVDPYVENGYFEMFREMEKALKESGKNIALLGATPTYPSEKYGYILSDDLGNRYRTVSCFTEKPSRDQAVQMINDGALWNCGVFCFRIGMLKEYADKYNVRFDYNDIVKNYAKLPKISFDYEVMEKAGGCIVLEYKDSWKDVGTWNTLSEEMKEKSSGFVVMDEKCENTNVVNALDVPVIVMGAKDMIVAASYDGILVADKEQSSYIKNYLDGIKVTPRYEERRWGTIKTIDKSDENGTGVCTNKVKVIEGQYTTYHCHQHHREIITVLSGEGLVATDSGIKKIAAGNSLFFEIGEFHAIKALTELRYIEVLMGNVENNDIERMLFEWEEIENYFKKDK